MPHPLLSVSQSDYLIQVFDTNLHSANPDQLASDLDLYCFQRQDMSGTRRTSVNKSSGNISKEKRKIIPNYQNKTKQINPTLFKAFTALSDGIQNFILSNQQWIEDSGLHCLPKPVSSNTYT